MPDVFRCSYSMLSAWERGDYQRALEMYIGLESEMTPAMQFGRDQHEAWEKEILETGCMPAVFGGAQLPVGFQTEIKKEVMLNDWLQLVGVLDLRVPKIGRDWKTGMTPANSYLSGKQHKVYQILYPGLDVFEYYSFNQHLPIGHPDQVKMARVHLTDKTLEDGVEFVLRNAKAMWTYIQVNEIRKMPKESAAELAEVLAEEVLEVA